MSAVGQEPVDSEVDSEAKTEIHEAYDPLLLRAQARVGHVLRDKWRLDVLLGVGGMAAVYAATHRNGSRAAVKLLHSELSINPQVRTRFLREGYVANKVGHDGAVKVLDDDVAEDGSLFLVTELLDGETLEDRRIRLGSKLSEDDVLAVTDQLLDVLVAAHAAGIVHRDLKPENVFTTRTGVVKVLDFGIARLRELSSASTATRSGASMGTPAYMPPEQARGLWDEVDGRSDLWAVGATMFHLLSGRMVHGGRTANEQLLEAMTKQAPPLASVVPGVSPAVAHVVDRALAFERDKRWPDAARMQEAGRRAFYDRNGVPISTAPRMTLPETVPNRTVPTAEGGAATRLPTTGAAVSRSRDGVPPTATEPRFSRGAIVALVLGGSAIVGLAIALTAFLTLGRGGTPVVSIIPQVTSGLPATTAAPAPSVGEPSASLTPLDTATTPSLTASIAPHVVAPSGTAPQVVTEGSTLAAGSTPREIAASNIPSARSVVPTPPTPAPSTPTTIPTAASSNTGAPVQPQSAGDTSLPLVPSSTAFQGAFAVTLPSAQACVRSSVPWRATVLFRSDGAVQHVEAVPSSGDPSCSPGTLGYDPCMESKAACIRSALSKTHVPPFQQPTFSVLKTVP